MALTRSQWKKRRTSVPHLPEEILVNIFVFLHAEVLYDVMRYVCKQWYAIINSPVFIRFHLVHSNARLLVQENYPTDNRTDAYLMEFSGKRDNTIQEFKNQFRGSISCTYDGLVVFSDMEFKKLFIANPATEEMMTLPPVPPDCTAGIYRAGLVRMPNSNKYKVVCVFASSKYICATVTVGADSSWRFVDCKHLTDPMAFRSAPTLAGGFFYWVSDFKYLVMDVETDAILEFSLPDGMTRSVYWRHRRRTCPMGNYLSVIAKNSDFKWDIWKLVDMRNREWTKLYTINLEGPIRSLGLKPSYHEMYCVFPKIWWNGEELLIYELRERDGEGMNLVYNVKGGEYYTFKKFKKYEAPSYNQHVSSLISWKDC